MKQTLITDYMTPVHTFRLGKVRGTNYSKGTPTHDRIIVDDQLLIISDPRPKGWQGAWGTISPLEISWDECAFTGMDKKRHVFMKRGVLEKPFFLDTIATD
jgi:hypothetical protein